MVSSIVRTLRSRDKNICHYCQEPCSERVPSRYPTRDHVVPKSIGGINSLTNYVLACSKCNNDRGTSLFYCECRPCREMILDYLYNPVSLRKVFCKIIEHNKPVVNKINSADSSHDGMWSVKLGYNRRYFETHSEAIEYSLSDALTKDVSYD